MSSLVEVEPYQLTVAEPHAQVAEHAENHRETNLLHLAWRNRWLILLCMIIGAVGAWVTLQRVTPRYTAASRVYIDRDLPQILSDDLQIGQAASYLYTQAELIRSTPVLMAVADLAANANLISFKGVDNRVGFLKEVIEVSVGSKDDIIDVRAELPDAKDAAQLVNSCVDAYITKYGNDRESDAVEILNILRTEKNKQTAELEKHQKALREFRKQHPELAVQVQKENVVTQKFAALSQVLSETELQLIEAKARYDKVKAMYDNPNDRGYLLESASRQQTSMRDANLETQVRQIEQLLTNERFQWGEGHPRVALLRDQYTKLQNQLKKQQNAIIDAFVESLQQDYEVVEHKYTQLNSAHERQRKLAMDVSSHAVDLADLEEAVKRTENLCDILDSRIKEVDLSQAVGAMNVSILEAAAPSMKPSYPVRSRFFASGLLGGGLIGFGLAWLRELLDHRLRSVEEIASVLQLPVLGALPHFGDRQDQSQAGRLVALTPRSSAAEAFRTLRTALHFGLAGRDVKVIVVTSPSPGDGKSTVASNLAIAMAQADQRVLLIDADLRKPKQHLIYEVSPALGLGTVLTDRRPVEEAIIANVADSLDLLPCGTLPTNPVELLNNGFFADMLNHLRERYDRIVIDSPPVMPVADARVIAALGEATLLVLRAERSTRRLAQAARNELWRVRATRLGVVVNGVPQRKRGSYGGAYGYGGGYGEYGYTSYGYGDDPTTTSSRPSKKSKALLTQSADSVNSIVDSA
jgi:polysaccharide biosynthesis transport protein